MILTSAKQVVFELEQYLQSLNKGIITIGLPGGRSIQQLFASLINADLPWEKLHFFMVDERLVPLEDNESNFRMLEEQLFMPLIKKKKITKDQLHPFSFTGSAQEDVSLYEAHLHEHGAKFDVVFLGVGEDGHVGANFPHHALLHSSENMVVLHDSPKPPPDRMTTTLHFLLKSGLGIAIFLGEGKQDAYANFLDTNITIEDCPAKIVLDMDQHIIFTDISKATKSKHNVPLHNAKSKDFEHR